MAIGDNSNKYKVYSVDLSTERTRTNPKIIRYAGKVVFVQPAAPFTAQLYLINSQTRATSTTDGYAVSVRSNTKIIGVEYTEIHITNAAQAGITLNLIVAQDTGLNFDFGDISSLQLDGTTTIGVHDGVPQLAAAFTHDDIARYAAARRAVLPVGNTIHFYTTEQERSNQTVEIDNLSIPAGRQITKSYEMQAAKQSCETPALISNPIIPNQTAALRLLAGQRGIVTDIKLYSTHGMFNVASYNGHMFVNTAGYLLQTNTATFPDLTDTDNDIIKSFAWRESFYSQDTIPDNEVTDAEVAHSSIYECDNMIIENDTDETKYFWLLGQPELIIFNGGGTTEAATASISQLNASFTVTIEDI